MVRRRAAAIALFLSGVLGSGAALDDDSNEEESAVTVLRRANVTVKPKSIDHITFRPLSEWFGGMQTGVDYKAYYSDHGLVSFQESTYTNKDKRFPMSIFFLPSDLAERLPVLQGPK